MTRAPLRQPDLLRAFSQGRSGRRQFWSLYALFAIPALGVFLVGFFSPGFDASEVLVLGGGLWALMLFVPVTLGMARRFHDIGWRGLWAAPQIIALISAIAVIAGASLMRPPSSSSCLGSVLRLGVDNELFTLPQPTEEQRADCLAEMEKLGAHFERQERVRAISLSVAGLIHLITLGFLGKRSQPGPNQYGPNPLEAAK